MYLPSKETMVKSFKTMQYNHCLSFDVIVSLFCTGQDFAWKCDLPLNGVVWSLGHSIPSLVWNRVALSPVPDASVSRYNLVLS